MAFVGLLCKARNLKHLKQTLIEEKQESIKLAKEGKTKFRFGHILASVGIKLKKCCKKMFSFPKNSRMHRVCYNIRHDGSCENYFAKSLLGFVSGFLLTYLMFLILVILINYSLATATLLCSIGGCIVMLGLAFSQRVRCIVLLTLPQIFSKKGRQALLAYAFILAMAGPCKNTLNNLTILSESLACGQEQLKQAILQIIDVIKKPFYAIKEAIKKVIKTLKEIIKKIKEILLKIKRVIMAIINVIKAAFLFIGRILNVCNKELGTPFERCSRVFENAITDCNAKLGPLFNWLCSLTYIVKSVCYIAKILDLICVIVDFISNSIIGVVIRKIKTFIRHIKTMFYVRIRFSHSFHFETNTSKTLTKVKEDIIIEVKERTHFLLQMFKIISTASALFLLFVLFRVCYYRYKYLTSDRFDNKYISKDFIDVDLQRAKHGKETILPLNKKESQKYVRLGSKQLLKKEKKEMKKATTSLFTASMKLCMHMVIDYALFWILNLINYYARFQSKVKAPNTPMVFVTGKGFLAQLLQSIVKAFQPLGIELEIDTIPCLPTPIPPDFDTYIQIGIVLFFCWFLTCAEPYGLRLRQRIMAYYYPLRAKQRSIWLYNHIMRSRSSFLKFARRQLRRKVFGDSTITKITCKEFLRSKIKCGVCEICLGPDNQLACLLCGEVFRDEDAKKPIRCATPGCPGVFCEECFADLHNLCTICLSPIDYGDISDISEEKDSSEDEPTDTPKKFIKKDVEKPDSDYYSTDHTSDYSYTYQDEPNQGIDSNVPDTYKYKDVEKQNIPDYATMEIFRDDIKTKSKDVTDEELVTSDSIEEILPPRSIKSSSEDFTDNERKPLIPDSHTKPATKTKTSPFSPKTDYFFKPPKYKKKKTHTYDQATTKNLFSSDTSISLSDASIINPPLETKYNAETTEEELKTDESSGKSEKHLLKKTPTKSILKRDRKKIAMEKATSKRDLMETGSKRKKPSRTGIQIYEKDTSESSTEDLFSSDSSVLSIDDSLINPRYRSKEQVTAEHKKRTDVCSKKSDKQLLKFRFKPKKGVKSSEQKKDIRKAELESNNLQISKKPTVAKINKTESLTTSDKTTDQLESSDSPISLIDKSLIKRPMSLKGEFDTGDTDYKKLSSVKLDHKLLESREKPISTKEEKIAKVTRDFDSARTEEYVADQDKIQKSTDGEVSENRSPKHLRSKKSPYIQDSDQLVSDTSISGDNFQIKSPLKKKKISKRVHKDKSESDSDEPKANKSKKTQKQVLPPMKKANIRTSSTNFPLNEKTAQKKPSSKEVDIQYVDKRIKKESPLDTPAVLIQKSKKKIDEPIAREIKIESESKPKRDVEFDTSGLQTSESLISFSEISLISPATPEQKHTDHIPPNKFSKESLTSNIPGKKLKSDKKQKTENLSRTSKFKEQEKASKKQVETKHLSDGTDNTSESGTAKVKNKIDSSASSLISVEFEPIPGPSKYNRSVEEFPATNQEKIQSKTKAQFMKTQSQEKQQENEIEFKESSKGKEKFNRAGFFKNIPSLKMFTPKKENQGFFRNISRKLFRRSKTQGSFYSFDSDEHNEMKPLAQSTPYTANKKVPQVDTETETEGKKLEFKGSSLSSIDPEIEEIFVSSEGNINPDSGSSDKSTSKKSCHDCKEDNKKSTNLYFSNVQFSTTSEVSSSASNRTSSDVSSLIDEIRSRKHRKLLQQSEKLQKNNYSTSDASSSTSFEIERSLKQKIKKYYKELTKFNQANYIHSEKKPKLLNYVTRFLPKIARENSSTLLPYQNNANVKITTFYNSANIWEEPTIFVQSPTVASEIHRKKSEEFFPLIHYSNDLLSLHSRKRLNLSTTNSASCTNIPPYSHSSTKEFSTHMTQPNILRQPAERDQADISLKKISGNPHFELKEEKKVTFDITELTESSSSSFLTAESYVNILGLPIIKPKSSKRIQPSGAENIELNQFQKESELIRQDSAPIEIEQKKSIPLEVEENHSSMLHPVEKEISEDYLLISVPAKNETIPVVGDKQSPSSVPVEVERVSEIVDHSPTSVPIKKDTKSVIIENQSPTSKYLSKQKTDKNLKSIDQSKPTRENQSPTSKYLSKQITDKTLKSIEQSKPSVSKLESKEAKVLYDKSQRDKFSEESIEEGVPYCNCRCNQRNCVAIKSIKRPIEFNDMNYSTGYSEKIDPFPLIGDVRDNAEKISLPTQYDQNYFKRCPCQCGESKNYQQFQPKPGFKPNVLPPSGYQLQPFQPPPTPFQPPPYLSPCNCCRCQRSRECHDQGGSLPNENKDNYVDLVQELENTLLSRNRNRVKRAMREFEQRSRHNRPLDQPIINYDEPSESEESILQKLKILSSKYPQKNIQQCHCKCCGQHVLQRRDRPKSPPMPVNFPSKPQWEFDERSGEWYKVNNSYQHRRNRNSKSPPPPPPPPPRSRSQDNYYDPNYYRQ